LPSLLSVSKNKCSISLSSKKCQTSRRGRMLLCSKTPRVPATSSRLRSRSWKVSLRTRKSLPFSRVTILLSFSTIQKSPPMKLKRDRRSLLLLRKRLTRLEKITDWSRLELRFYSSLL
jgi:hypothetical protein